MSDNADKKDRRPVRVEPELKQKIETEASRLDLFEYEILDLMWKAYKRSLETNRAKIEPEPAISKETSSGVPQFPDRGTPKNEPSELLTKVQSSGKVPISPREKYWIDRFTYVLQQGPLDTVEAILRNVQQFYLLARLFERESDTDAKVNSLAEKVAGDAVSFDRAVELIREHAKAFERMRKSNDRNAKGSSKKRA